MDVQTPQQNMGQPMMQEQVPMGQFGDMQGAGMG